MSKVIVWIVAVAVAAPILWLALKLALTYAVPVEKSGKNLLKRFASGYGVNVATIPEGAWAEIVALNIPGAKRMVEGGGIEYANWRANLVRILDKEALIVARLINDEGLVGGSAEIEKVLIKYGVLPNDDA